MLFTPLLIYTSIINIDIAKKSVYYRVTVPFITKPLLAEIQYPYYDWFRSLIEEKGLLIRDWDMKAL